MTEGATARQQSDWDRKWEMGNRNWIWKQGKPGPDRSSNLKYTANKYGTVSIDDGQTRLLFGVPSLVLVSGSWLLALHLPSSISSFLSPLAHLPVQVACCPPFPSPFRVPRFPFLPCAASAHYEPSLLSLLSPSPSSHPKSSCSLCSSCLSLPLLSCPRPLVLSFVARSPPPAARFPVV